MHHLPPKPPAVYSVEIPAVDSTTKRPIGITRISSTYPRPAFAGCAIGSEQVFVVKLESGQSFPLLMEPRDEVRCFATAPIATTDVRPGDRKDKPIKAPGVWLKVIRP